MTIHKWLDFSRDQDQDTDPGISQRILLDCTQGELSGLGGGLQSPTVSVFFAVFDASLFACRRLRV